ncbi:MAG: hypothetical protein ACQEXJ_05395 [Myxococcota bacterium]
MKRCYRVLVMTGLAAAVLAACGTTTVVTKKQGLKPATGAGGPVTQDGVVVDVEPVTELNMKGHPKAVPTVQFTNGQGEKGSFSWALANLPMFRVKITNRNEHVLRFTGATWKLIDGMGTVYDAVTKSYLRSLNQTAASQAASQNAVTIDQPAIDSALNQLPLLNDNAEVLPGYSKTFYVAFQVPKAASMEEHRNWMEQHPELTFALFDLVTATDEAGNASRRTKIETRFALDTVEEKKEVRTLF